VHPFARSSWSTYYGPGVRKREEHFLLLRYGEEGRHTNSQLSYRKITIAIGAIVGPNEAGSWYVGQGRLPRGQPTSRTPKNTQEPHHHHHTAQSPFLFCIPASSPYPFPRVSGSIKNCTISAPTLHTELGARLPCFLRAKVNSPGQCLLLLPTVAAWEGYMLSSRITENHVHQDMDVRNNHELTPVLLQIPCFF
jgi:hypothetical protein